MAKRPGSGRFSADAADWAEPARSCSRGPHRLHHRQLGADRASSSAATTSPPVPAAAQAAAGTGSWSLIMTGMVAAGTDNDRVIQRVITRSGERRNRSPPEVGNYKIADTRLNRGQ